MKAILSFTAAALAVSAATAQAPNAILQLSQAPHGILIADTDKDGAVSRREYLAMNIARFDRMDADHDGRLTPEERTTERAPNAPPPATMPIPHPSPADLDGDGFVSRAEFFFNVGTIYAHFDANNDGRIAGNEIAPEVKAPAR